MAFYILQSFGDPRAKWVTRTHTVPGCAGEEVGTSLSSPHHLLGCSGCIWSCPFRAVEGDVEGDVALTSPVRASSSAGAVGIFPDLAKPKPKYRD